jgi:hypothetical protein
MSLGSEVTALLTGLTPDQIAAMPPVERQHLADQCRRIAALADAAPRATVNVLRRDRDGFSAIMESPRSGVLADPQARRRDE